MSEYWRVLGSGVLHERRTCDYLQYTPSVDVIAVEAGERLPRKASWRFCERCSTGGRLEGRTPSVPARAGRLPEQGS